MPEREEIGERLDAVLEAIYAAYSEGWGDPGGIDDTAQEPCDEAIWLGRLAAGLMPDEAEAESLVALMLFAEARRPARRDVCGPLRAARRTGSFAVGRRDDREAETRLRRAGRLGSGGLAATSSKPPCRRCMRRGG